MSELTPTLTESSVTVESLLARIEEMEWRFAERVAALEMALVQRDDLLQTQRLEAEYMRVEREMVAGSVTAQSVDAATVTTQQVSAGTVTLGGKDKPSGPRLVVDGDISGNLVSLDTREHLFAIVRAHDLLLGSQVRSGKRIGAQGRALVDEGPRLIVNFAGDWPNGVRIDGNTFVNGQLATAGGLWSPSGRCRLEVQDDGNVVLYHKNGSPIWASGTAGKA